MSIDPGSVIPGGEKSGNVVGAKAKLNDNGKAPDPLSITISNDKITWGLHHEGDVVGYRVYKDGKKVASINAGGESCLQSRLRRILLRNGRRHSR